MWKAITHHLWTSTMLSCVAVLSAQAADYFVATDGDDANPGTMEQPWATPFPAENVLIAGDTLYLRGGTYAMDDQFRPVNAGTAEQPITIAGYPGELPVLDAMSWIVDPNGNSGPISIYETDHYIVRNIKVQNSRRQGISVNWCSHIVIEDCIIDHTYCSGIGIWGNGGSDYWADDIVVQNNVVTRANWEGMKLDADGNQMEITKEPPHEAISLGRVSNYVVANNVISNCSKEGIDSKGPNRHGKIYGNHIYDIDRQAIYLDAWTEAFYDCEVYDNLTERTGYGVIINAEGSTTLSDVHVHNNVVVDGIWGGITIAGNSSEYLVSNVRLENNTIVNAQKNSMKISDRNLDSIIIRNNIIVHDDPTEILLDTQGQDLAAKNVTIDYNCFSHSVSGNTDGDYAVIGDPLFVDAANGDYSLQSGSPAINAGHPGVDYLDQDGTRADIGALPNDQGWVESFSSCELGDQSDTGVTAWSISGGRTNVVGFQAEVVDDNGERCFQIEKTVDEVIWESSALDAGAGKQVAISLRLRSDGTLESADYVRVYAVVDGSETLLAERTGNFNGDLWENIDAGTVTSGGDGTVTIRIRAKLNWSGERLLWDDITMAPGSGEGDPSPIVDWLEDFSDVTLAAIEDTGETAWTSGGGWTPADRIAEVVDLEGDRCFQVEKTGSETLWESEAITIGEGASADVSLNLRSGGAAESADYVRVYVIQDGIECLLAERTGNFNDDAWESVDCGTVDADGSGMVQIRIRSKLNWTGERYYWDDIQVNGLPDGNL